MLRDSRDSWPPNTPRGKGWIAKLCGLPGDPLGGPGPGLGGLGGGWCPSSADDDDSVTSHKSLDFSGLPSPYSSNEEGDLTASVPSGPVGRDLNPGWGPTMRASSECGCAFSTPIATRELGSAHPTAWGLARKPFGVPPSTLVWAPAAPVTHGSPAPDLPWPSPIYLVSQAPSPCLARRPRAWQVMFQGQRKPL